MPTVTETEQTAFAHCVDSRCHGNSQEEVSAVRRETARTYREMGGDSPGVECSWVSLLFADDGDAVCPSCGRPRELTDQRRTVYPNASKQDPMGLLGVPQFDPTKYAAQASRPLEDPERKAMQEQLAVQAEAIRKLEARQEERDALG